MTNILHLTDDNNLGGVGKVIKQLCELKVKDSSHRIVQVDPTWRLDQAIFMNPARHFLIHYTISWRKLPFLLCLRFFNKHVKFTLIEHSYTRFFAKKYIHNDRRFRLLYQLTAGLCDHIIAISSDQHEWLKSLGPAVEEKITYIPQSTQVHDLYDVEPVQWGVHNKQSTPLKILAIGRFHEQKGFDQIIEAVKKMPEEKLHLTLVGYGEHQQKLKQLANGLPNVEFQPATNDVKQVYEDCDIVTIPSNWEAFGLVMLEAKAAARVVIASDVDGLIDQHDPHWSFSFPSGNIDALADCIQKAAQADLYRMGKMARRDAQKSFPQWQRAWTQFFCNSQTGS